MPTVRLIGQTIPGATVELVETGATTTSDSSGNFAFYPVNLPTLAAYTFTVEVTDVAGNVNTQAEDLYSDRQHLALEPDSARRDARSLADDGPAWRHGHFYGPHARRTTASRWPARSS